MFDLDHLRPVRRRLALLTLLILPAAGPVATAATPGGSRIEIRGAVKAPAGEHRAGATASLEPVVDRYRRGLRALAGHAGPQPVDSYRTGEDGTFLLVAPEPGMWRVVIEAPGRVPVERRLTPLFEDTSLPAVELPEDTGVTVTVVDPEGRPVPRARVRWTSPSTSPMPRGLGNRGWSPHGGLGTTNAGGRLHLPRAEGQTVVARAWASGLLPSQPEVLDDDAGSTATLRLPAGRRRVLRVRDPAGQSIAGVLVTLAGPGVELGTTDEQGRLAAILPASGAVDLLLDAGGGWRRQATLELQAPDPAVEGATGADSRTDGDPLEVTLDAPVLLTGRVVDGSQGSPLAGALVWPRGEPGAAVESGEDGGYEIIAGGAPDEMVGAAAGHRVAAVRAEDAPAGRIPLLRLPPAAVLAGTLSDPSGEPIPGARIRLRTPPHPGLTWDGGFGAEAPGATSDDRGRFRAVGLDAGTVYLLRVEADGFPAVEQPVEPPARLDLVLERGGGLTAAVTDPYGAPVAGARVRLFPAPEEAERLTLQLRDGDLVAEHETHTDHEGRFVLDPVATGTYDLRIDAPGLAPLHRMGVEVPGNQRHDLGRLTAEPAVAVEGRIVDGEGEPVAGARVSVDPFSPYRGWSGNRSVYTFSPGGSQLRGVVSDDDGRFRLGGLAAGVLVDLEVAHDRHQDRKVEGVEPPVEDLEIELAAGVRVTGRVLDSSGRPVRAAQVQVRGESAVHTSAGTSTHSFSSAEITDRDGRFDVAGLKADTLSVEARSGDLSPASAGPFAVEDGDRVGPLELVLGEPMILSGTVFGADGEPVPGANVTAVRRTTPDANTERTWQSSVRTGPAGRYRIRGLPAGTYALSAEAGATRAEATIEIDRQSRRLDLQLEEHRALTGRVLRSDGGPAVRPRIEVRSTEAGDDGGSTTLRGTEDGSFVWSDPPVGVFRLLATAGEERGVLKVDVGPRPPRGVTVRLRPGAEVRGRIEGVEPAAAHRVQVSARPVDGGRLHFGRTDHRGDYRVGGLLPGEWLVTARLAGVGRAEERIRISEPSETVLLDLELDAGTRVYGSVTLDGEPLAGAHVELMPVEAGPSASRSTNALHDGSFEIAGLETGRHRLRVAGDFAAPGWLREVDIAGDEELFLDLESVEVSGRVLAPDGTPVDGARVALGPPGDGRGNQFLVVVSDERGLFRIPAALPGSYVLRADAPGHQPTETPLRVDVLDVGGLEIVLGQ